MTFLKNFRDKFKPFHMVLVHDIEVEFAEKGVCVYYRDRNEIVYDCFCYYEKWVKIMSTVDFDEDEVFFVIYDGELQAAFGLKDLVKFYESEDGRN